MIYYLFYQFFAVLLIIFQNSVADIFFSGKLVLELSIIVVIYTGFRLNLIKGAISSFILGFTFDCISGSILGIFTLIYVLIFLFSFFVSTLLVTERSSLIALFALFCSLLEVFLIFLFYNLIFGFEILQNISSIFLLQAIIISLLSPLFFYVMSRVEVIFYGKPSQSAQWTGTCRIPEEN
jgi:rod shape-determining protein MreD